MLQMISEGQKPRIRDFGTPKRYYPRMRALKEAQLVAIVMKKGNSSNDNNNNSKGKRSNKKEYKLTALGQSLYESLPKLRHALSLYWKLNAIDALDKEVPLVGYNKLVESLIQDEALRKVLLKS
jgi:hypothetical protein